MLLILLTLAMLFPLYYKEPLTLATDGTAATTSLELVTSGENTASVSITPSSSTGTFASSSASGMAAFKVYTNNIKGYTLTLSPASGNTNELATTSGLTLSSITNSDFENASDTYVSSSYFSNSSITSLNGKWGISFGSTNDTASSFYPAGNTITIGDTEIANTTNVYDTYYIGLGVRVSSSQTTGTYNNTNTYTYTEANESTGAKEEKTSTTNTYILTALGNPVEYEITFADKSGDNTVSNLPSALASSTSNTSILLKKLDGTSLPTPTRTGYTFSGWCDVDNTTNTSECKDGSGNNGTTYSPGDAFPINQTTANVTTLHAVWSINTYTQTIQYRYQTATGSYGDYTTITADINYGESYSWSTSSISNFDSTTYTSAEVSSYTVTSANTKQVNIDRNTFTVRLSKGTGISAVTVTGTGVKSGLNTATATVYYGGTVTINATLTNSTTYAWVNWTGSATYTNRSQNISNITANKSFTANGKLNCVNTISGYMQNISSTTNYCAGASGTVTDNRDSSQYQVAKLADGKIWMLDNLSLYSTSVQLNSSNSNVSSGWYLPSSSDSGFLGPDGFTTKMLNSSHRTETVNYALGASGTGKVGVLYNFCAASAGTYCLSTDAATADGYLNYDICPKGWRLPTSPTTTEESGEWWDLYTAYSKNSTSFASAFHLLVSGYMWNSGYEDKNSYGQYWSRGYYQGFFNSSLVVGKSNSTLSKYDINSASPRVYGQAIRCILK